MEYAANSHKARANEEKATNKEEKKVEQIQNLGPITRRKKPLGKRFIETFFGGTTRGVWGYVTLDVLIPAVKDMVADATSQGIERMLFGEASSRSRRSRSGSSGPGGYVSYNRMGNNRPGASREEPRSISRKSRATHNFDEIVLATRVEAEEVIDRIGDLVSQYGSASVADLYDMIGLAGDFTDNKWGWTDIRESGVDRIRDGYLLNLPKPEPLD